MVTTQAVDRSIPVVLVRVPARAKIPPVNLPVRQAVPADRAALPARANVPG